MMVLVIRRMVLLVSLMFWQVGFIFSSVLNPELFGRYHDV
jgi:hypothetical protein